MYINTAPIILGQGPVGPGNEFAYDKHTRKITLKRLNADS